MYRLIFLILILSVSADAQTFKEKFVTDFCQCFDNNIKKVSEDTNLSLLKKCITNTLEANKKEFTDYIIKDIDTTIIESELYEDGYAYGYAYGQKFYGDIQEQLVNDCDSYYQYTSELSSFMKKNMEKGVTQKNVDSLTRLINKDSLNIALIWERGANKIGLKKYKSAQSDFKYCLSKDVNYIPAMFFLAWSYHLQGDFKNAILTYQNVLNQKSELGSIGDITKIYLATLKRKLRDKKNN
ncbi:hypothetical protein [uncultured Psychroserpens sp.]|uniref:tetratricopeptide repeat protein n=1 Tax=uncultured Psychroserpens sp. TaxID=255436 RepID=UPI002633D031|nr:hypothetical protein [uncultured Psychroserpens sp.]